MSRPSSPSWNSFRRDSRTSVPGPSADLATEARLREERRVLGPDHALDEKLDPELDLAHDDPAPDDPTPDQGAPERPSLAMNEPAPPEAPLPKKRSVIRRVGRYALGLGAGLGLAGVFVGTFAGGLVAHLNAPASRRAVAALVSDVASSSLQGKIELADLRHVGLHALDVGQVTIRDPQGHQVIVAHDVYVQYDLVAIVRGALASKPTIGIDGIVLREVDVTLIDDGTGSPTLVSAFLPKTPKPKVAPKDSDMRIALRRIDLEKLKVDGTLAGQTYHTLGSLQHASVSTDPFAGTLIALPAFTARIEPIAGITKEPATLTVSTTVHIPGEDDPPAPGIELTDLTLSASTGTLTAKVTGTVVGGRIAAHVVGHAESADVASFTGQPPPLWAPVDVDVSVDGTMVAMNIDAKASLGGSLGGSLGAKDGSAHVKGTVNLEGLSQKADAKNPRIFLGEALVDLDNVDVQAFAPTAPPIRTSADISVHATAIEAGTELTFVAERQVLDPTIEDPFKKKVVPGKGQTLVAVDGKALLKKAGGVTAAGSAHVSLERTKADVGFHLDTGPGFAKASVVAHVAIPALSELKLVKSPVRGAIELDVSGDADLVAQTFEASGQLRGTELRKDTARIAAVVVDLNAKGTFSDPAFSAKVTAPSLEVLDPKNPNQKPMVRDLVLDVFGTPKAIAVATKFTTSKDQKIELATHVVPTKTGVRIVGLDAKLARNLFRAELKVKELAIDNGDFKLTGFRLSSTGGGLRLDGSYSPRKRMIDLDVASSELDLGTLAYAAGVDLGKMQSTVTIEGKLKTVPRSQHPDGVDSPLDDNGMLSVALDAPTGKPIAAKMSQLSARKSNEPVLVGHLKLHAKGEVQLPGVVPVPTPNVGAYEANFDLDVDDRLVQLGVDVKVRDLFQVALHGGGAIAGRYDDLKAWENAAGHLAVSIPDLDLARIAKLVVEVMGKPLPVTVSGNASLYALLQRPDPLLPPMGTVELSGKKVAIATPTLTLEPFDFDVKTRLARTDDKAKAKDDVMLTLAGDVRDAVGSLVKLHVTTDAAWSKMLAMATGTAPETNDPKAFLAEMPVYGRVVIPKRKVKEFPAVVRSAIPLDGELEAKLSLDGTIGAPKVSLDTELTDVKIGTGKPHTLSLTGDYDGKLVKAHAMIVPRDKTKEPRLAADAEVKIDSKDLLSPADPNAPLPWTAKADVTMKGLPLAMFSSLATVQIAGVAYGEIHLDHVNDPAAKSATVDAKIDVDSFTIGDSAFDKTTLEAKVDDTHATAKLALEGESGNLHGNVDVPLTWKTALAPGLTPGGKIVGAFDAKDFRLRTIEPFATPFDSLDGLIDADVKIGLVPPSTKGGKLDGGATGTIKLRQGVMIVSAIGERWDGVTSEIAITPQKVEVKSLNINGVGGHANITAYLTMAGIVPQKMHAQLDAKRFPFSTNGVPVGALSGKVVVDGDLTKEMADFVVKIDPMTVDLAPSSDKHPQDLEPEPSIVILEPVEKPNPPPSQGSMPLKIAVNMPDNVWIRRDDLRMAINGSTTIVIKQVASITGEVQVDEGSHGYAEVFGKRFVVDHAKVDFDGGSDINPVLDIAVKWEAPDGSTVTVTVSGRLQQPKVDLTSDPPGTQAEIMSLLVLGRRDAGSASQQDQASRGAAAQTAAIVQGMTGAIIGQQLQKALPTSMSLSFQPGDNGFSDGKYGGGYQKGKFYFEVGYNAGAGTTSAQGGPGSQQYEPRTTFGVEYRFKPMWSLMTTLGDTGSALVDLLWNYRY